MSINKVYKKYLYSLMVGSQLVFGATVVLAQSVEIKEQPLATALKELGRQTGLQMTFKNNEVKKFQVSALSGDMTTEAALEKLLAGTQLDYEYIDGNTVVITRKGISESETTERTNVSDYKATDREIEDIIVTASKRGAGVSIQDTAMSITAVSGEEIERKNLVSMQDYLNSIPGVTFKDFGPGLNQIIMRGVGLNLYEQATVSSYFGEIPLTPSLGGGASVGSPLGGSSTDIKLVDIERIEVLKGPQGTLYGSGTMGGTVRNIPVAPQLNEFGGSVNARYGVTSYSSGDNNKLTGVLNIPLIDDTLAMRVAAYRFDTAGYIDSVSTAEHQARATAAGLSVDLSNDLGAHTYSGGRGSLLWQASAYLKITLMLATQKLEEKGDSTLSTDLGGYKTVGFIDPSYNNEDVDIANLVVEYDLQWSTFLASFSSVDGFTQRQSNNVGTAGFGGTIVSYTSDKTSDVLEMRLASQLDGPIQFVAGMYYENSDVKSGQTGEWPGSLSSSPLALPFLEGDTGPNGYPIVYLYPIAFNQSLDHRAVFGELSYSPTPEWELSVGARWFDYDRRDNNLGNFFFSFYGEADTQITEQGSTYKINISYSPNEDTLLYAQRSEGFRLGHGQSLPPSVACDIDNDGKLDFTNAELNPSVKSDTTTNYEIGGKFTLLDNRLTLNAALYRIDWEDIPVTVFDTSDICPGFLAVDVNSGEARTQGAELETRFYPIPDLQLSLSASYTDTELLTDAIGKIGDRLPLTPRVNSVIGAQYDFEISGYHAFWRTDYSYMSGFIGNIGSALSDVKSHGKWNMRAGVDIGQWSLALYGNNLINNDTIVFGGYENTGRRMVPRTVGVEVGYSF